MPAQIKFTSSSSSYPTKSTKNMEFAPNPLSLSVPEAAFDSWLRDSGYLSVLDQRTTDLHRVPAVTTIPPDSTSAITSTTPITVSYTFSQLFSDIWTLFSLLTINPFSKLATDDFSGDTQAWTVAFIGNLDSYSFPSSSSQARLRVHENVKRFARNYASLVLLFFACSLYQLPLALCGLISCLAFWEAFKFSCDKWGLDEYPVVRQTLLRVAQCMTAIVLFQSNFQLAILCALGVGYAVMILHASFRKLTPGSPPAVKGGKRTAARR